MKDQSTIKWRIAQSLELKWWKKYLSDKNINEYLVWKAGYWDEMLFSIEKYIELPEHHDILDAGCGPAGIFIALKRNSVVAVDPLLDEYVANGLLDTSHFPWTTFVTNSLENIEYTDKFDYIFCLNAINHVNDLEKCYDNLVRALKPGGTLIISTDAHRHGWLKKIFQWLPGDMLHPVQLDIREYNEHLTKRGLSITQTILYKKEPIFDYYITLAKKG